MYSSGEQLSARFSSIFLKGSFIICTQSQASDLSMSIENTSMLETLHNCSFHASATHLVAVKTLMHFTTSDAQLAENVSHISAIMTDDAQIKGAYYANS